MEKQKNIPILRFPEFSGEWEIKRLDALFKISAGGDIPSENVKPEKDEIFKYPVYANAEKNKGFYGYSDIYRVEENVLTVAGRGVNIGIAHARNHKFYPIVRLLVLRPRKSENINFFEYQINLLNLFKESTGVPQLTAPQVSGYEVFYPQLPEQTKIATFLTSIDERLGQLKKKKTLLEEYKKGVMQKIFDQKIRFKDDDGNEFPDWEEKRGNLIFESISDKNHNSDLPILAITQEFGAIPRDLIDYNISVTDKSVESYKVVQVGDFIISLRSFQGGIEFSNYKGICSPAYIILRSTVEINNYFFKYYFKTETYIKLLNVKLEGIRDGKMISYKYFSDIKLPFPCVKEQTKIAIFLSAIDEKINQVNSQINKTEQYKKGLLQQMFV